MMGSSTAECATARAPKERSSGVFQTSPGMLRRHLVGPWGEGLAQYLALSIGDRARGRAAYASLLRMLAELAPEDLLEAPGPKARLYRLARSIAETERAMPAASSPPVSALPFRRVGGSRGASIERLRAELTSREAELLELRHARELSVVEIACVLEQPADEAELALDAAEARGRQILEEHAPDLAEGRALVYLEAFALEAAWAEEGASADVPALEEAPLGPGEIIGGRYRVVERVGVGAFGDVYRAEDTEVRGHRVALKVLRQPSLSERARQTAMRELRMNAAAFHPSLVQFKDHGWYEQRLWFVMPWYEGETLEQRIRRGGLSRAEARAIFEPLARALSALHAAGIRHQDIKPENVLLTRLPGAREDELLPVLIDLGVAAGAHEGLLGGTPLYFAPEVAARFVQDREAPGVGTAADVFALALSLRNSLEPGTQEDVAAGAIGAFVAHRSREAPPLPEAPSLRYLRPWLARCLSVDPGERPSAEELVGELAILTAPEERRARRARVARWLVPLLVALGAIFAAVVHHLDQRADRRELDARRAESAAAEARADLIVAGTRRRALEDGHAELLQRYEQGRLSRRELAGQLATSENQVRILRGELTSSLGARDAIRAELAGARRTIGEREIELGTTRTDRDAARRTIAERESELGTTRTERDEARREAGSSARELDASRAEGRRREGELADLRTRTRDLSVQLASERGARESAEQRATSIDVELAEAQRAERSAQNELARVRQQVARLAAAVRAMDETASDPSAPAEASPPPRADETPQ